MANLTRAQMINRVLKNIGVLAAGESTPAVDDADVGEVLDSVHKRLRKDGLAPFATSAIPDWAQSPLRDVISAEIAIMYGLEGQKLQAVAVAAQMGKRELAKYTQGEDPPLPVQAYYF